MAVLFTSINPNHVLFAKLVFSCEKEKVNTQIKGYGYKYTVYMHPGWYIDGTALL